MNENLHRLSIQITKRQYALLKQHSGPGTSISSIIRQSLDEHFEDAEQILGEQAIESAKYEEFEKYMINREKAGLVTNTPDASLSLIHI